MFSLTFLFLLSLRDHARLTLDPKKKKKKYEQTASENMDHPDQGIVESTPMRHTSRQPVEIVGRWMQRRKSGTIGIVALPTVVQLLLGGRVTRRNKSTGTQPAVLMDKAQRPIRSSSSPSFP